MSPTPTTDLSLPSPAPDELHLWGFRLTEGDPVPAPEEVLDSSELARAEAFRFPRDRRRYVRSHCFLRSVLAAYLGIEASAVTFAGSPKGKPLLDSRAHATALDFNLTHAGELALIAVTDGIPVGIDVEPISDGQTDLQVATRFFALAEAAALASLPPPERARAFCATWTRKEAFVKACGEGLSCALDSFAVEICPETSRPFFHLPPHYSGPWSLVSFEPAAGYLSAVACATEDPSWVFRWWPPEAQSR
ncbi:4'-phosphopantetheinyl transferase superfamily protein [bacterium]|nr:4'-phosphopantetheinyl transferase superfamily protein [bacterium]